MPSKLFFELLCVTRKCFVVTGKSFCVTDKLSCVTSHMFVFQSESANPCVNLPGTLFNLPGTPFDLPGTHFNLPGTVTGTARGTLRGTPCVHIKGPLKGHTFLETIHAVNRRTRWCMTDVDASSCIVFAALFLLFRCPFCLFPRETMAVLTSENQH